MAPVVVIRPQSGYINRIQAIVSAQLMAEELGSQLLVDWELSSITPVGLDSVLAADFCERHSVTAEGASRAVGVDVRSIPPYLEFDPDRGLITLAGLEKGEQFFMPSLRSMLRESKVSAIVISAGGKFTLSGGPLLSPSEDSSFRQRRHAAYSALSLHHKVEEAAAQLAGEQGNFLGLHLRYSDRSLESPWRAHVARALRRLHSHSGVSSLFIASDTRRERDRWLARASSLGLRPWCADRGIFLRTDEAGAYTAMVDWRLLTRAKASVYFAASSFAEEAVVASGGFSASSGLRAGPERIAWNRCRKFVRDGLTYPRRLRR